MPQHIAYCSVSVLLDISRINWPFLKTSMHTNARKSDWRCEHRFLVTGKLLALVFGTTTGYGEVVFKLPLIICMQSLNFKWMCPRLPQFHDFLKNYVACYHLVWRSALIRLGKDWLAQCQDNVTMWGGILSYGASGPVSQWDSTTKPPGVSTVTSRCTP